MKKILLVAALVGTAVMANAQESFAPKKGDISTEIQFNPFSGKEIFSNGGVLNGTYFFTNKDAAIIEFGLSGENNKDVPDTNAPSAFNSSYNGEFVINIGYQRHFYNYKRLGLYCGGKIGYIHQFAGAKEQQDVNNYVWNNQGTGNGFNIYVTTGFNFFVYKGLYLGAEINLGFSDIVATNWRQKVVAEGVTTETKTAVGGHNFKGGFGVNPLIRLGWKF